MENHLSDEDISRFHRRVMAPAELIEADDHLMVCEQCGDRMRTLTGSMNSVLLCARIRSAENEHLCDEEIESYADGVLDSEQRDILEDHLRECGECKDSLIE